MVDPSNSGEEWSQRKYIPQTDGLDYGGLSTETIVIIVVSLVALSVAVILWKIFCRILSVASYYEASLPPAYPPGVLDLPRTISRANRLPPPAAMPPAMRLPPPTISDLQVISSTETSQSNDTHAAADSLHFAAISKPPPPIGGDLPPSYEEATTK